MGVSVSRVVIYNRIEQPRRLSNSVVSLINYQGTTLETYRIGDATNVPVFDVNFETLVRKVRVQLDGRNFLHMREVEVYDTSGVNRALNKPATQSSTFAVGDPASTAVNGNLNDFSHTLEEAGNTMNGLNQI